MNVQLYNSDCLEGMKNYCSGYFDYGIVDPPYGLKQNISKVKSRQKLAATAITDAFTWDNDVPSEEYFSELWRICKHVFVFGANYFTQITGTGTTFKAPRRPYFELFLKHYPRHWIIWDKCNGANDFSDCELIYTTLPIESCIIKYMWNGMQQGKSITEGHVQQGNKQLNEKRIHPTQKPVLLYRWLYERYITAQSKVISTHMGSGSDVVAALQCDHISEMHAYEIDTCMYSKAVARINNSKMILRLWNQK